MKKWDKLSFLRALVPDIFACIKDLGISVVVFVMRDIEDHVITLLLF